MGQRPGLGAVVDGGVELDAVLAQALGGVRAEGVGADGGEQLGRRAEPGQLDGGDAAAPARVGEDLAGLGDLPAPGDVVDERELDPLDVADDGDARGGGGGDQSTSVAPWRRSQRRACS